MKKVLVLLSIAVLMIGCGIKKDSINFVSLNNVNIGKLSGSQIQLNFDFTVENTSSSTVTIKSIEVLVVDKDDLSVLSMEVNDQMKINKNSKTDISAPVTAKFQGLLGILGAGSKLRSPDKLFLNGTVKYKVGCLGGTYKFNKVPLKDLLGEDGKKIMSKISL